LHGTQAPTTPEALRDYLDVIGAFNTGERLRVYPGSPLILHHLLRPAHDRLRLFELHPSDSRALDGHVVQLQAGRSVTMARQDGFESLKALLPPPPAAGGSRRALVLMDPSYEIKTDYGRVLAALQEALRRFSPGVYVVWYPVIPRPEAHDLPRRLKTLAHQTQRPWLHAVLGIGQAASTGPQGRPGLLASGVFVINAPHTLSGTIRPALEQVLAQIGRGRGQRAIVESG
jgi:23S rRNA (adenine2030-N6)-methyltransferase